MVKYSRKEQIEEVYGKTQTKAFRYVPASISLEPESHAVFPFEMMEEVIRKVKVIALVHCPCRATAQLIGKKRCDHPLENCIKYDDLAEYLIEKGIGREITKQEALEVLRKSEEAGLVHLVDNAREGIKHTCNCCGCCCWSVGTIRRKKIPRDVLMATYFLRETDRERCTGCGQCVEICPVQVIRMEGDFPVIDREWCIGCGVCAVPCPASAVRLVRSRTPSLRETSENYMNSTEREKDPKARFFVASFLRMTGKGLREFSLSFRMEDQGAGPKDRNDAYSNREGSGTHFQTIDSADLLGEHHGSREIRESSGQRNGLRRINGICQTPIRKDLITSNIELRPSAN